LRNIDSKYFVEVFWLSVDKGEKMNNKQIIAMWIGIVVFVLIICFTDTRYYDSPNMSWYKDFIPISVRSFSCVLITFAAIYTLKDNKQDGDKK
jgi:predicted GNAT superfamily acetyltransferase